MMMQLEAESLPLADPDAPWIARAEDALALFGDPGARVVGHFEHRDGVTVVRDLRGRVLGHADDTGTWDAAGRLVNRSRVPEALLPNVGSAAMLPH